MDLDGARRKFRGDLWTQSLTLTTDVVTAAPQEIRDLPQETHDQTPRTLLAEYSQAELSLAEPSLAESRLVEPSLAEPSRDQLVEYD